MKKIDKIDVSVKHFHLVEDFKFQDYSPMKYPCPKCGRKMKLIKYRVLFCPIHKGKLHPRYDFDKDAIM